MIIKKKTNIEKLNESQQSDFGSKTNGEFRRQIDKDITYDKIENTDWSAESKYHNTYYNTTTKKYGSRTIRMNNKDWHTLQNENARDNNIEQ